MATKHYCSCNPASKPASEREASKWYCYRHRRHLCNNCIYDDLNQRHISCLVGTYDDFIKSGPRTYSRYKNKCPLCDSILPDDAMLVIRLNCACVYHSKCLQQHLLSKSSNNIPCIKCNKSISPAVTSKKTNLSESVNKFLKSISRQRLWHKPKQKHSTQIDKNDVVDNNDNNVNNDNKPKTKTHHEPHILLDTQNMTRHRTVKSSLNKDGNKEDDKYHKPKTKLIPKNKFHHHSSTKTRWSTSKILLILLLCFAFIAQIWFLYMIFAQTTDNNTHLKNDNNNNDGVQNVFNMKQNDELRGLVDKLPNELRSQLYGNKAKIQELQKRRID